MTISSCGPMIPLTHEETSTSTATAATTACSGNERSLTREDFQCAICFDALTFPVTLSCGHNFDRGCLLDTWAFAAFNCNNEDEESVDSQWKTCPLCRASVLPPHKEPDCLQVNKLLQSMIHQAFPQETQTAISPAKQNPICSTNRKVKGGNSVSSSFWQWPLLLYSYLMDPPGFGFALFLLTLGFFYMLMVPFAYVMFTSLSNWADLMNSTSPFFGLSWFQVFQMIF